MGGGGELSNDFCVRLLKAVWSASDSLVDIDEEQGGSRTFATGGIIGSELLDEKQTSGSSASATLPLESLIIDGIGELRLPLSAEGAEKLRTACEQAPYGHGMATMVDTKVRKAWQLDASKVKFKTVEPPIKAKDKSETSFLSSNVQQIAKAAVRKMGLDSAALQVEARLYKLLLYEPGGHFRAHRDTEKEKGMFGTLVLQLPTATGYQGGALVVKHRAASKTFDFASSSRQDFCFTAFFADCEHELQKVTSGYRLSLVFNLVRQNRAVTMDLETLQGFSEAVASTEAALKPWFRAIQAEDGQIVPEQRERTPSTSTQEPENEEAVDEKEEEMNFPDKLAIPLQHKYTEANLSFAGLKGEDRFVAEVLKSCKDAHGQPWLDVQLCMLTKHLVGMPEDYDMYDEYDAWGRRYDESDEDEEEDSEEDGEEEDNEEQDNEEQEEDYEDDDEEDMDVKRAEREEEQEKKREEAMKRREEDRRQREKEERRKEEERKRKEEEERKKQDAMTGSSGYRMAEVHNEDVEATDWIGADDKPLSFYPNVDIETEVIYNREESEEPFDVSAGPDDDEVEGYTGNEGPTLEFWYHTAVLVIWPKSRAIAVACDADFSAALCLLERKIAESKLADEGREALEKVVSYLEREERRRALGVSESRGRRFTMDWMQRRDEGRNKVSIGAVTLLGFSMLLHSFPEALRLLKLMGCMAKRPLDLPTGHSYHSREQTNFVLGKREAESIASLVHTFGWKVCSQAVLELLTPERVSLEGSCYGHLALQLQGKLEEEAAESVGMKTLNLLFSSDEVGFSSLSNDAICSLSQMILSLSACLQEYGERFRRELQLLTATKLATLLLHLQGARYPRIEMNEGASVSSAPALTAAVAEPNGEPQPQRAGSRKVITVKDDPLILEVFLTISRLLISKILQPPQPQQTTVQSNFSPYDDFYAPPSTAQREAPLPMIQLFEVFLWLGDAELFAALCQAVLQRCRQQKDQALLQELYSASALCKAVAATKDPTLQAPFRSLFTERIEQLMRYPKPQFSWQQPQASLPAHPAVEEFLRGPSESFTYGIPAGLPSARQFAAQYFGYHGDMRRGYSATATEGGRGKNAFVTIRKTRALFEAEMQKWESQQSELKKLLNKRRTLGPLTKEEKLREAALSGDLMAEKQPLPSSSASLSLPHQASARVKSVAAPAIEKKAKKSASSLSQIKKLTDMPSALSLNPASKSTPMIQPGILQGRSDSGAAKKATLSGPSSSSIATFSSQRKRKREAAKGSREVVDLTLD